MVERVDVDKPGELGSPAEPAKSPRHTSMLRKLLELLYDALIYGVSGVLSQLIGFLLLPLYTRFLTPQDYGVMAMLTIVGAVFEPLARVGITQAVFRFYGLAKQDSERRSVLGTGLISVVVSTSVLLAIGLVAAGPLALWITGQADAANLLRLTLVTAALGVVNGLPLAALRADRRVKVTSSFNLIKLAASLVLTIALVVWFQLGILGVILGSLVAEIMATVGLFSLTFRDFPLRFSRDLWRSMIAYGAPYVPHHLQAVGLDLFGIYLVRQKLGIDEAGLYNMAIRFALPLSFTVTAIQQAWSGYKFHRMKSDDDPRPFFGTVVTYYVAGITYLWLGIALWGPEMIHLMTTKNFHAAAPLIWTAGLITVGRGMYFMLGTGIELAGSARAVPLVSFAGLVTVIGLSFPLVENYGAHGAAGATALGWLVMAAMVYVFAQRVYRIHYDWPALLAFGTLAAVMAASVFITQGWPLGARLTSNVALSLAYPLCVFLILCKSPVERQRMLILLHKLRGRLKLPQAHINRTSTE